MTDANGRTVEANRGHEDNRTDLVLNPGEYSYLQDETKANIKTYRGPTTVNKTPQDRPVKFENGRFKQCTLAESRMISPFVSETSYLILENPSQEFEPPKEASSPSSPVLLFGRKVNIPGPCNPALWPGQKATVVEGHRLNSNEYLLVTIYNQEEATKNWETAVVEPVSNSDFEDKVATAKATEVKLTVGKRLIIKGTEVSYYIPPTGVEVVPEVVHNGKMEYVRKAVTLERLEHAILIDENGEKRYERGQKVVFPSPTEEFFRDEAGHRKFKAIELNALQGIHVKIIAPYKEGEQEYKEGDEIFITGKECPIYYPRPEHSVIEYDGKQKHYATVIPPGEGKYIMSRETGAITTVKGHGMILPNPITEVFVRRILTDKQIELWYPANQVAIKKYNHALRDINPDNSDFIAEQAIKKTSYVRTAVGDVYPLPDLETAGRGIITPETFQRGTTYTEPRQITLDTKFGVPPISPYTGFAVMVVSKSGNRRVEVGPNTILLDYDETLEELNLSTSKPKTTDNLLSTVYLRILNNKVSDIIKNIMTSNHVECSVNLSYRVDFEGEPKNWFNVENYVKFLTDHIRSMLKGAIRKIKVEDFYQNGADIIRNIILGKSVEGKRPGMRFEENGMVVKDVEVLEVTIEDKVIRDMLATAQHDLVSSEIQLNKANNDLEITKRLETIARETLVEKNSTDMQKKALETEKISGDLAIAIAKLNSALEEEEKRKEIQQAREEVENIRQESKLARDRSEATQNDVIEKCRITNRISELRAEAQNIIDKFTAIQPGFSESLLALSNQETLTKVAEALSVQNLVGGKNFVDVIEGVFGNTELGSALKVAMSKTKMIPVPALKERR